MENVKVTSKEEISNVLDQLNKKEKEMKNAVWAASTKDLLKQTAKNCLPTNEATAMTTACIVGVQVGMLAVLGVTTSTVTVALGVGVPMVIAMNVLQNDDGETKELAKRGRAALEAKIAAIRNRK